MAAQARSVGHCCLVHNRRVRNAQLFPNFILAEQRDAVEAYGRRYLSQLYCTEQSCRHAAGEGGQLNEAIAHYQKAVQLNTSYADAYNNLGVAFLRSGQVDQAIADYKKAVAINPESAEMQYNLGNALAHQGNWADAIACYQAAVSTERDSVKAAKIRNNLGAALERLGTSDEALEQFSQAVQINGNYPEAHCNLGRMLAQRGRRDEAVAHLKEAVRLKPEYEAARKQLRDLGIATAQ